MPEPLNGSDASVLAAAIEAHHPDPFRAVSRDTLLREFARVDGLDTRDRSVLAVELMRTLALLGPRNGHTAIHPLGDHPIARYLYPLAFQEFDDGVFVIAAEREDLVGSELVAIEGTDVHDLLRAVTPLICHDNEWTVRARRPTFVVDAAILRGLALVDDNKHGVFRLSARNGSAMEIALEAITTGDYRARVDVGEFSAKRAGPAYLRRRREPRWAELAAQGRAVHVAYNLTRGHIEEFAREVETLAAPRRVGLVVLDLRHNSGGDNRTYAPLLHVLEQLVRRGKRLAVLTSRTTFSAAMQLVVDLETRTPAVFVGEPTGGSPNHYGDAAAVELSHAGVNASVATIAWMTAGDSDERLTREPDISVVSASRAFFGDDDPTLDIAMAELA